MNSACGMPCSRKCDVKMWDVRTSRNGHCMWCVMRIEREHMGTGNEQCMWHAM